MKRQYAFKMNDTYVSLGEDEKGRKTVADYFQGNTETPESYLDEGISFHVRDVGEWEDFKLDE